MQRYVGPPAAAGGEAEAAEVAHWANLAEVYRKTFLLEGAKKRFIFTACTGGITI